MSRTTIKISAEGYNDIARTCAGMLQDRVYLRGTSAFAVVRAVEAGGAHETSDADGAAVEISGVRHQRGSLVFTSATADRIGFWLDEMILFKSFSWPAQAFVAATCPQKLANRIVAAATELAFRSCAGIARTPLLVNGTVVSTQGWNPATGMILDLPDRLPPIPAEPTRKDAKRALKALLQPFRGYINDNPDLAPLFAAAALTAALRAPLPTAPGIVIDGNTIGAGKGKAARALAVIAAGGLPAVITEGHNDEETEKRISAAVLQGAPAILIDNLQRPLASTTLESILTDPVVRIRKFGSLSDDVVTECRALALVTANNAALRRDLLRRTLHIRIVVNTDKPELRRFDFDPVDEARRTRARLLGAAFTIARAWHRKRDLPEHAAIRERTLGSFEIWANMVAGAVEWLTGTNPIDAIEARRDTDATAEAEQAIVCQLYEKFAEENFTAAEAAAGLTLESWSAVITVKSDKVDGRAVGNWLMRRRDRTFRSHHDSETLLTLTKVETDRKGFASWRIAPPEHNQIQDGVVENGNASTVSGGQVRRKSRQIS
jgi:hypothetical protein